MKLINTYTNVCFAVIVIKLYQGEETETETDEYNDDLAQSTNAVPFWLVLLLVVSLIITFVEKCGAAFFLCFKVLLRVESDGRIPVSD